MHTIASSGAVSGRIAIGRRAPPLSRVRGMTGDDGAIHRLVACDHRLSTSNRSARGPTRATVQAEATGRSLRRGHRYRRPARALRIGPLRCPVERRAPETGDGGFRRASASTTTSPNGSSPTRCADHDRWPGRGSWRFHPARDDRDRSLDRTDAARSRRPNRPDRPKGPAIRSGSPAACAASIARCKPFSGTTRPNQNANRSASASGLN